MDKKTPLWQLTEAEGTAIWLEMIWAPALGERVIKDSKSDVSAWQALQELLRKLRARGPLLSHTLDGLEHEWQRNALEHERSPIGRSAFEAPV